jgi:hypothetical protein
MPLSKVVLQAKGPLPLKGSFDFQSTSPATLIISGTARASFAGPMGVGLWVDGNLTAWIMIWANETASHKALVTCPAPINLGFGTHQYSLDLLANTQTDINDSFSVVIIY